MAIITQRGVDRFTKATRDRFAAENEQFDRAQRLKRAARGPMNFDPEEDAAARRVQMERARQQQQDLMREQQGVRERYADPKGQEFQSSQRLFDAEDVSILPEAVLARHGRMAPSELVRTERDRVNGGGRAGWTFDAREGVERANGWGAEDDFTAGAALGSRKMMDSAVEQASDRRAAELVDENKLAEADYANGMRVNRAKRVRDFDVATARGQVPGAMINPASYTFGSGGTMERGGRSFDVPMGMGQDRQAVQRPGVQPGAMLPGMIDPAAPEVIDQRYKGAGTPSRTGARAVTAPSFDDLDSGAMKPAKPRKTGMTGWKGGMY